MNFLPSMRDPPASPPGGVTPARPDASFGPSLGHYAVRDRDWMRKVGPNIGSVAREVAMKFDRNGVNKVGYSMLVGVLRSPTFPKHIPT